MLRWLDELDEEGSGLYSYDTAYDTPELIAFTNIYNVDASMHLQAEVDGVKQWLTGDALHAAAASAAAAAAAPAAAPAGPAAVTSAAAPASASAAALGAAAPLASASAASGSALAPIDLEVTLRTSAGKMLRISSAAILSSDPYEWLNDCQYGNLQALMERPERQRLQINYPRSGNVSTLFKSKTVCKVLAGSLVEPPAALLQNYVGGGHWRKLAVYFTEKVVYYWEPYGGELCADHDVLVAFDEALGSRGDDWRFECITIKVQTDGHNCGPWDHVGDRAFVAYLDSDESGGGRFANFFQRWLEQQGVANLKAMDVSKRAAMRAAVRANEAFIGTERDAIRARLLAAARAQRLVYQDGPQVDIFVEQGDSEASAIDLEALDEGDDEHEGGDAAACGAAAASSSGGDEHGWASALGLLGLPQMVVANARLLLVREAIVDLFAREAVALAREAMASATGSVAAGSAPSQRRTVDAMDVWCTKAELALQLSGLVSQREAPEFSEEELEAALYQLGSSSVNFIMCSEHNIYLM